MRPERVEVGLGNVDEASSTGSDVDGICPGEGTECACDDKGLEHSAGVVAGTSKCAGFSRSRETT